jgi:hypothetical protein
MNYKGYGKKQLWPNLLHRHSHELEKITKRLSQCICYHGRDLNPESPEYKDDLAFGPSILFYEILSMLRRVRKISKSVY